MAWWRPLRWKCFFILLSITLLVPVNALHLRRKAKTAALLDAGNNEPASEAGNSVDEMLTLSGTKSGKIDIEVEPGQDDSFFPDEDGWGSISEPSSPFFIPGSQDVTLEMRTPQHDIFLPLAYPTVTDRYSLNGDYNRGSTHVDPPEFRQKS